jgi:WD40 repeat protein
VNGAMLAIALTVTLTTPSPVGTLLLPANGKSATALCRDHKLRVFSLPDGKLLRTIDGTSAPLALSTISDDGRWVMLSDYRGDVSIVDTATGESRFKQHVDHYLTAAAFSHDGRLLAAAPGAAAVRIIDVAGKRVINELERAAFIGAIAFSRDNKWIATADGYGVSIFEIGGKRISRNDDFLLSPLALDFSADGKKVMAGGADKVVLFIDAATGKTLGRTTVPDAVMWTGVSPDGKHFAVATMNADNLQLPSPVVFSDIASPQKKSQWMPPKDVVGGGWTADGHFIAAIATQGAVRLQSVR